MATTTTGPSWANANASSSSAVGGVGGVLMTSSSSLSQPTIEQHEEELFANYSTLDEPVMETIMRDVRAVQGKLKVVLSPLDRLPSIISYSSLSQQEGTSDHHTTNNNNNLSENDRKVIQQLKDWDLWGPLILCLALSVILSFKAPTNQSSLVFASVFCTVWIGGTIVTMNAQLLGGTISFFQSLCVLGYSIFPMTMAAFIVGCIRIFFAWIWIDFIVVCIGFWWSIRISSVFFSLYIKPERRFLALYPVFFFYIFLGWISLLF